LQWLNIWLLVVAFLLEIPPGEWYHMLHQTISQMHTGQKILCVNGPWWFVQMWLQLYMHRIVNIDLNIGFSPHPATKKGKLKSPEDAKPMEKLLQPSLLTKMSVNFLSSSSEVSLIPFGSHI
jgi:hypothetical protein